MSDAIKLDYEQLYIEQKKKYNDLLTKHYELERYCNDLAQQNQIFTAQMEIVHLLCGSFRPAR